VIQGTIRVGVVFGFQALECEPAIEGCICHILLLLNAGGSNGVCTVLHTAKSACVLQCFLRVLGMLVW
jgi:hypothetical protein